MSAGPRLILASASPRRRELLAAVGLEHTVDPADIAEPAPERMPRAERFARHLARAKAQTVAARHPGNVVLAADTIVVDRGRLLGKPESASEARAMLRRLRGRRHRVITGVAVARDRRVRVAHAVTGVTMRDYGDDEIDAYVATGEPFDKAGGYAIQDDRLRPAASWDGCYCNVVGLPLVLSLRLVAEAGISLPPDVCYRLPKQCRCCPFRSQACR